MTPFRDRGEAGRILAGALTAWAGRANVLVLALPRGGVPVGFEVAHALQAPLDVFLVRKLGVPGQEELAMGAIASGGARVLNDEVVRGLDIPPEVIARVASAQALELERRERLYRAGRPAPEVSGRTLLLIDDGLATGASMRVAARALRLRQPERLVIAVPVAASDTCQALAWEADEVVCARTPHPFYAVGSWYQNFAQTTDAEVCALLAQAEASFRRKRNAP